ncbi:MAG: OmpA family protein [Bdellovibrionota bacterium]
MERASSSLDTAISQFEESDKYVDPTAKAAKQAEATGEAEKAERLASNAREAMRKMRSWDAEIQGFNDDKAAATRLKEIDITLNDIGPVANRNNSQNQGNQQGANRESAELPEATTQTVAHFRTNSAKLTGNSRRNIREVANVLSTHPNLRAEVLGYADARGPVELNKKLATQRSQAVANELKAMGVADNRVSIRPLGEQYSLEEKAGAGSLQLDRKVDVRLYDPAQAAE